MLDKLHGIVNISLQNSLSKMISHTHPHEVILTPQYMMVAMVLTACGKFPMSNVKRIKKKNCSKQKIIFNNSNTFREISMIDTLVVALMYTYTQVNQN